MTRIGTLLVLAVLSSAAQAHYLWIERDAHGAVRGYYGEWDNGLIEKSGANLDKIVGPKAFLSDPNKGFAIVRQADHLAVSVSGTGDVRLTGTLTNDARKTRSTYYAKNGRRDLKAVFDLEFVPAKPGSDELTLLWKGAPLVKAEVTVYGPPKWKRVLTTDEQGRVTVPAPWAGQYIVEAIHLDDKTDAAALQERQVATVTFVTTTGVRWAAK
jgi:uncharacterized GH25 family protein